MLRRTVADGRSVIIVRISILWIIVGCFERHHEFHDLQAVEIATFQAIEIVALHATIISLCSLE